MVLVPWLPSQNTHPWLMVAWSHISSPRDMHIFSYNRLIAGAQFLNNELIWQGTQMQVNRPPSPNRNCIERLVVEPVPRVSCPFPPDRSNSKLCKWSLLWRKGAWVGVERSCIRKGQLLLQEISPTAPSPETLLEQNKGAPGPRSTIY